MSRSNPNENGSPNPATRWFEWNGEHGNVRYYDKKSEENVAVDLPFTFILLDQLSSVRGWHESSKSGIYSNLVKDTRSERMTVKSFKGGVLAEGLYKDIKADVRAVGGRFNANLYLAFKVGDELKIGVLQFKGAALGAWMEFAAEHRAELYKQAITIHGTTEGQKGRVTFHMPAFKLTAIAPQTNEAACALDAELQGWMEHYMERTQEEPHEEDSEHVSDEQMAGVGAGYNPGPITDEDIPF